MNEGGLSFLDDIEINFEKKCEMRLFLNLETDFAFLGGYFLHPRLFRETNFLFRRVFKAIRRRRFN